MSISSIVVHDADETAALGRRLAALLKPSAVIALVGPLGAGKTTLVRAIAEGLGADPRRVKSPTFALIHEYAGRLPIYHFDAYRLPDAAAFADLGIEEYFSGDGVCLIEWADRVESVLPEERLTIQIEPTGESTRLITLQPNSSRYEKMTASFSAGAPRDVSSLRR